MLFSLMLFLAGVSYCQARAGIMCFPNNGYLTCPKNQAIKVHNITIGCTDQYICEDWARFTQSTDSIPGEQMPAPAYSGLRISEVCNNRRECIITGLHYERCRGRYKYVIVNYDCITPKCENKHNDKDCDNWATGDWAKANGTECVNNPYWMAQNCYKSCTKCNAECMNYHHDDWQCDYWAQVGECEHNRDWMSGTCERSCSTCSPANIGCINWHGNDAECDKWAKNGDCDSRPQWMTRYCRKSCNRCHKICRNILSDARCNDMAAAGDCERNPKGTWATCTKACGKCPATPSACVNAISDSDCETRAKRNECYTNAEYMITNCVKTCLCLTGSPQECSNVCRNDPQCDQWAEANECNTNPGWMINNCRRSCKRCD